MVTDLLFALATYVALTLPLFLVAFVGVLRGRS